MARVWRVQRRVEWANTPHDGVWDLVCVQLPRTDILVEFTAPPLSPPASPENASSVVSLGRWAPYDSRTYLGGREEDETTGTDSDRHVSR